MEQTDGGDMARVLISYKRAGDQEPRSQLVVYHLPIVRSAAVQLRTTAGSLLGQEDLTDQGVLALMECLNWHDPDRGVRFETYAFMQVRGFVIDYMRSQDWMPHRAGNSQKRADQTFSILSHEKMGEPDVKEVAGCPNLPMEKMKDHIKYTNHAAVLSSESMPRDMAVTFAKGELEAGDIDGKPEESLCYEELMEMLTTTINGLGERKRLVIMSYYYKGLKYSEIAEAMGVGQLRMYQIYTKAIRKLKSYLEDRTRG